MKEGRYFYILIKITYFFSLGFCDTFNQNFHQVDLSFMNRGFRVTGGSGKALCSEWNRFALGT